MPKKERGENLSEEPAWKKSQHVELIQRVLGYLERAELLKCTKGRPLTVGDRRNRKWIDWMIEEGYSKDTDEIHQRGFQFYLETRDEDSL